MEKNFIILGEKENQDENENVENQIDMLNNCIHHGKHVFLFTFMDGCGPCNNTKPQWDNVKNHVGNKNNVVVVRMNHKLFPLLKNMGNEPMGYPSLRHVTKNGVEEYEDWNTPVMKDRSSESFKKWIDDKTQMFENISHEENLNKKQKTPKKNITRKRKGKKRMNQTGGKRQTGGKWSLKYKKSINCKHPKGFSQRQHCKYGRGK